MRASGACARSFAVGRAGRAARRLRPAGRGPSRVGAPADERQRVGEEQRAAEREHQLAHHLVVEAHAPRLLAAASRRSGSKPRIIASIVRVGDVGSRPTARPARRRRPSRARPAVAAGRPSAARHRSVSTPRSGSCPWPVAEHPEAARPSPGDRRASAAVGHVVRAGRHRDAHHLRGGERRRRRPTRVHVDPVADEIAVVAAVALVDRHRRARAEHVQRRARAPPASAGAARARRRACG